MVKLFKYTAILEGVSFLALFANMLLIKPSNLTLYKIILFPLSMTHGLLFISYIVLALLITKAQNWDIKTLFLVLIASLLPFATFFVEKKFLKNV